MKPKILSTTTSAGSLVVFALLLFCAGICQAQNSPGNGTNQVVSPDYVCVQRGPYSKIWQRTFLYTNEDDSVTTNSQSYTELGTGICYLQNGAYVDSVEEVDPVPTGGAQAIQGRHQVQWAVNANNPGGGGVVLITTPDGKRISSSVLGMAYYDVATGSNVSLGLVKDCNGVIVAPNQVLYADAFSNVTADIVYTYTKSGLSQDIVLQKAILAPDAYGLSDASSVLQIYTAFYNVDQPEITAVTNGNVVDSQILDFGDMKMAVGQALFMNSQGASVPAGIVTKQWIHATNANYLIEAISFSSISNQIQQLQHTSNLKPERGSIRRLAFLDSNPTRPDTRVKSREPMKLAKAEPNRPRLVVDYVLLSSSTNLTLQGDSTYFVTSTVNVTGTTSIEGGTVVKYTNGATAEIIATNIACLTSSFSPGIFSSWNDSSVGAPITTNTVSPVAAVYLNFGTLGSGTPSPLFRNLRFSYASQAISGTINSTGANSNTIWDCQFINCTNALYAALGGAVEGFPINMYNVLFSKCHNVFSNATSSGNVQITFVNATADQIGTLYTGYPGNDALAYNSLFTSVTNLPTVTLNHCVTNASSTGFYQTVGAGSYYLANGSTNQGVGTTNINAAVLADLQTLTTYPPVVTNGSITTDYTFSPQVQRDTGVPDIGFHYFPIDYALNITVSSATMTVVPGTALAMYGSSNGIWLDVDGIFDCEGTATSPNYLVRYNTVQEQSNTNWTTTNWNASLYTPQSSNSSWANFAFTDWSVLGQDGQLIGGGGGGVPVALQDSQFYGGTLSTVGLAFTSTNCLYHRVNFTLTDFNSGNVSATFYNNLFLDGELAVRHLQSGEYVFRDNLFDQTAITQIGANINSCSNNAYTTNNGYLTLTNGDIFLPNSPAYKTGALGVYYYPTNLTNLIYKGSQPAPAAGLYYYTVTTNNVIEGTNTVSIGFHYAALDTNGVPFGAEDGEIPDYLDDPGGNVVVNPFLIYDQSEFPNWPQVRLAYWKFNTYALTNEGGVAPISTNLLSLVPDWSGNAVALTNVPTTNTNSYNELVYPITSDGQSLFDPANGTIRFWYQPNWSNGSPNEPTYLQTFFQASGTDSAWTLEFEQFHTNVYVMMLDTASNQFNHLYTFGPAGSNGMPITFQSNLWYQFAFTYSPSNMALYTNGVLLATATIPPSSNGAPVYEVGTGMTYYPPASSLTSGISFGTEPAQPTTIRGLLDEMETFNYPLTAQQVAAGFPYFGGNTSNMTDTYYVGRSDMLQTYVDGIPPSSTNTKVVQCRLGYWRFDSPLFYAEQGQMPLSSSNVGLAPSWSGTALVISNNAASQITYPDVGSNGWANFNCRQGSVRFWFKPNASGGPAQASPFVYMGTADHSQEWNLWLNIKGEGINFETASNGAATNFNLSGTCVLTNTNQWTQIVLTYGSAGSTLYINGTNAGSGLAVTNWPSPTNRQLGMVIGNNTAYNASINGQFEEMETFNYQLSPVNIAANFQTVASVDSDLDGIPDILEDIHLTTNRPFLGAPVVITGTIKAEQFDMGSNGIGYSNTFTPPTQLYRPTGLFINTNNDLGGGYCLDQMASNEWAEYTIDVLVPQNYMVEVRAEAIGAHSGGIFRCEFATNGVFYTNTASMTNTSTNWTIVTNVVFLQSGTNVMKLHCLTNAPSGTNVGRFNYISIYPWWPTPTVGSGNQYPILNTNTNYATASNNAVLIQNAINLLGSGGGTVWITNGNYLVAQASPNEINAPWQNAAVSIMTNNIAIAGAGETNTTLIAYNRVTTVFSLGESMGSGGLFQQAQCTNFTLRDMTLEAQPHRAVTNVTSTFYNPGQIPPPGSDELTVFYGLSSSQFAYNILVTNCQFLYADRAIVTDGNESNVMVRACNFVASGGLDTWGDTNVYTGQTNLDFEAAIFGSGYNVVVLENNYNGNILITNTNSTPAEPWFAGDGLLYLQGEGNVFIARNMITNHALEAVQLAAGPSSVVGNTFYTFVSDGSCCALDLFEGFNGILGSTQQQNYYTCFVGNSVYGGRHGIEQGATTNASTYNCSGNSFTLYPPFLTTLAETPSFAAQAAGCKTANVCGNTLIAGGVGFTFNSSNTSALILNNNFGAASYRGIGYGSAADSLSSAQIFGNSLGEGVSFHVQLTYTNSFGWFLGGNTFVDTNGHPIQPFFDPTSSAVHLYQ